MKFFKVLECKRELISRINSKFISIDNGGNIDTRTVVLEFDECGNYCQPTFFCKDGEITREQKTCLLDYIWITDLVIKNANGDFKLSPATFYEIRQLPISNESCYRGHDKVEEINLNNYVAVWRDSINQEFDEELLDIIYRKFNMGKYPDNYCGRSLSVSDILIIKTEKDGMVQTLKYYCDSFGWVKC